MALCISGQMRTYKKCYGYLKENVIEPLEPDIFIDTWSERGGTTKTSGVSEAPNPVTESTLKRLYSPKSLRIEDFEDRYFKKKDGVEVPKRLQEHTSHWKGNIPMFYKMKGCNDMKKEYECEHSFTYDIVIKLRPDLLIGEEIPQKVLDNPEILWHTQTYDHAISDKFAVSSSENMDYYTSVWNHLNEYWSNPLGDGEWENVRVGERLMRYHMEQSDIPRGRFSSGCKLLRTRDFAIEQNTATFANQFRRLVDQFQRVLNFVGRRFNG